MHWHPHSICRWCRTVIVPTPPAHLIASQPPTTTPIQEFLVKWNAIHQFFLKNPLNPIDGMITVPDAPGLGLELDDLKVAAEREITFRDF